jgi:hypothetical protein
MIRGKRLKTVDRRISVQVVWKQDVEILGNILRLYIYMKLNTGTRTVSEHRGVYQMVVMMILLEGVPNHSTGMFDTIGFVVCSKITSNHFNLYSLLWFGVNYLRTVIANVKRLQKFVRNAQGNDDSVKR